MNNLTKYYTVVFFLIVVSCSSNKDANFLSLQPKNEIFIAHAGGNIENIPYTNCLEALNENYKKGSRLFELDFAETSDSKLVAVHDWQMFKEITNAKTTPTPEYLTEKAVITSKIHNKFTPLNMKLINEWFSEHRDAVLVTDKINNPNRLVSPTNGFLYKDRTIMELFTWEAVEEAIKLGITPMVSQDLLFEFEKATYSIHKIYKKEKTLAKLKKYNIRYACFSVKKLTTNPDYVRKLKNLGIKTYVYHVNYNPEIDENYVYKNYLDLVTGMYADNLDLLSKP